MITYVDHLGRQREVPKGKCSYFVADKSTRASRILGQMKPCGSSAKEEIDGREYCARHAEMLRADNAEKDRIARGEKRTYEVTFEMRGKIKIEALTPEGAFSIFATMKTPDLAANAETLYVSRSGDPR